MAETSGPRPNGVMTWQGFGAMLGGAVGLGGLLLTILGFMYAVYGREQGAMSSTIGGIQARELAHSYQDGQRDQKITDARQAVRDLDITLQREMRLLDEATSAASVETDRRLQGEIATIAETLNSRVDAILIRLEEFDARQRDLIEFTAGLRTDRNTP